MISGPGVVSPSARPSIIWPGDLSAALDEAQNRPSGISVTREAGASLVSGPIALRTPQGRMLTHVPPLRVEPGTRLLIRGL
ncbi:hypothetical protein, partial [Ideonella sp. B508-1]|uniref:hypothetical protein n=1 Tax=Ideonella sp. B508-1 TaxID=137716 RepID=UPI0035B4FF53